MKFFAIIFNLFFLFLSGVILAETSKPNDLNFILSALKNREEKFSNFEAVFVDSQDYFVSGKDPKTGEFSLFADHRKRSREFHWKKVGKIQQLKIVPLSSEIKSVLQKAKELKWEEEIYFSDEFREVRYYPRKDTYATSPLLKSKLSDEEGYLPLYLLLDFRFQENQMALSDFLSLSETKTELISKLTDKIIQLRFKPGKFQTTLSLDSKKKFAPFKLEMKGEVVSSTYEIKQWEVLGDTFFPKETVFTEKVGERTTAEYRLQLKSLKRLENLDAESLKIKIPPEAKVFSN